MSVYMDILNAVASHLAAVPNMPTPTVREVPFTLPADFPLPAGMVCPLADAGEKVGRVTFGANVRWHYPVLVLLLHAGNRAVAAGLEARLQLREDARNALFVPLLDGAALVYNVEIDPAAAADVQAALGANVIVAGFRIVYQSSEQGAWAPAALKGAV